VKGPRRGYRDLLVWQRSVDLAVAVYELSDRLPSGERFELARDLRRSARSIPSNLAEGFNRFTRASYRWHVLMALGSQGELETQLEIAVRMNFLPPDTARRYQEAAEEVGRMLHGLRKSLEDDAR
jgi:four helix bundle protein